MGLQVSMGAVLQCTFGQAPSPLMVLPTSRVFTPTPAATIMDHVPFLNIIPFAICNAPTNPMVIAAKLVGAEAPCIPITPAPWIPGGPPTLLLNNMPALNNMCKLMCIWAGVIQVVSPGQFTMLDP